MSKVEQKLNSVFNYVRDFIQTNSYPPTVREICAGLDISSTSMVYSYIDKLVKLGKLEKQNNKNRSIGLANKADGLFLPLVGTVSAGAGILAVENIEGYYNLPKQLFNQNDLFLLRVTGNSMIEVGIFDGDLVVIKQQNNADNNQIVLAMFDDVATIKRFIRRGDKLYLHPENSNLKDIVLDYHNSDVQILGIVVGCIKKF
ncbi:MAG: transcriptional repressor LexA [Clostridia bacterium]